MEANARDPVPEAPLEQTETGVRAAGEGWFVVNAAESPWLALEGAGRACTFEPVEPRFSEFGCNVHVLSPGEPNAMYHGEQAQEAFLVISGECLLLVEGEERQLRAWDYVHFPPWTRHVLIGAGDGPAVVVMVGARKDPDRVVYPVEPLAQRHGAGVDEATDDGKQAYAKLPDVVERPYESGTLPGA